MAHGERWALVEYPNGAIRPIPERQLKPVYDRAKVALYGILLILILMGIWLVVKLSLSDNAFRDASIQSLRNGDRL